MPETLENCLSSPEKLTFEGALSRLSLECVGKSTGHLLGLLCLLISQIDNNDSLNPRERERRIYLLLKRITLPSSTDYQQLALRSQKLSPIAKNALKNLLPPEYLPLIYSTTVSPIATVESTENHTVSPTPYVETVQPDSSHIPTVETFKEEQRSAEWAVVLLLGTHVEHEMNHNLLKEKYAPLRVTDLSEFNKLLNQKICGIVIGSSWWTLIDPNEHELVLRKIISYSNFVYLKINVNGLPNELTVVIRNIVESTWYAVPSAFDVAFSDTNLSAFDLSCLGNIQNRLNSVRSIRIHPAAIDDDLGVLLLAATMKRLHKFYPDASIILRKVDCSFLKGGRSEALILLLQPTGYTAPFVAKVDEIDRLRGEMDRFKHFISPWDTNLFPELFIHGDKGVIFFGMVGDAGKPGMPAPTYYDRVEELYWSDFRGMDVIQTEQNLKVATSRVIQKLEDLAKRRNGNSSVKSCGWITCENVLGLTAREVKCRLPSDTSDIDIAKVINAAFQILSKNDSVATIHGDVNLRNILVNDDLQPYLIDYAYSGPGHPCYDIVRFESALLYGFFKMLDDEKKISCLIEDIVLTDNSYDQIMTKYSNLLSLSVNRLAVFCAIEARDAILRIIQSYNLTKVDYLAMKIMIAFQSFTIIELQQGIVRSTISVLAHHIETK